MNSQPINSKTLATIDSYLSNPGQSIELIGQKWLNKTFVAKYIASRLLEVNEDKLESYPYYLSIGSNDLNSISIDEIRSVNDFLILKVPNKKIINRIIIIERAERLTLEAQNALLKNLEEPPKGTVFILAAESLNSLLPTIISRLNAITVHKPDSGELTKYYQDLGYEDKDIKQALLISDGLPGLADQLLLGEDNQINEALATARKLLSSTTFERLSLINELSKNKAELNSTLFVIKQMAKIGVSSSDPKSANRWKKVLSATLESERKLSSNVQLKLLLTDYMLRLA